MNVKLSQRVKIVDVGLRKISKMSAKEKIVNENHWISTDSFDVMAIYTVHSNRGNYMNIGISCTDQFSGVLISSDFIYINDEKRSCYR